MLEITPNAAYNKYLRRWETVDDVVDGEPRLKEVDLDNISIGGIYLRLINTDDKSSENVKNIKAYIKSASLFNVSSVKLSDLMHLLFRKAPKLPEIEGSSLLGDLLSSVDGSGLSMEQQSQSVAIGVIKNGRRGLLTDMPRNDDGSVKTRADVKNGFRPMIKEYSAASIIDWYDGVINGANKLTMLVLLEYFDVFIGGMGIERDTKKRYLVYKLTTDGVTLEVYSEGEDEGLVLTDGKAVAITGPQGVKLDRIPFSFIGSRNNSSTIDSIPLEPMVMQNLDHYRQSGNIGESTDKITAVQPVVASDRFLQATQNAVDSTSTVETGAGEMLALESGGTFNYVSPSANLMAITVQKNIEERIAALGGKTPNSNGVKTAEEARINRASEASDLSVISANITNGYNERIKDAFLMTGETYDEKIHDFKLNDVFFDNYADASMAKVMLDKLLAEKISKSVYDDWMKSVKLIDEKVDLELMNEAIANESGAPLGFGD